MRISRPIAYIVLYVALYAAFGVSSPFWPKVFETRALTPQQIGLILDAAMLVRLAAGPLIGMLADLLGSLRLLLATCAALAAASAQVSHPPASLGTIAQCDGMSAEPRRDQAAANRGPAV